MFSGVIPALNIQTLIRVLVKILERAVSYSYFLEKKKKKKGLNLRLRHNTAFTLYTLTSGGRELHVIKRLSSIYR